jgi:hypothetical protein
VQLDAEGLSVYDIGRVEHDNDQQEQESITHLCVSVYWEGMANRADYLASDTDSIGAKKHSSID